MTIAGDMSGETGAITGAGTFRARAYDFFVRHLETERARWFYWLPVAFGAGVGIYFSLPTDPGLPAVTAVLAIAGAAWVMLARATVSTIATGVLLAAALGGFAAKLRTEAARAPVLEKRIGPVWVRGIVELVEPKPDRGERITLRVVEIKDIAPEETPLRVRVRTLKRHPELKPGNMIGLSAVLNPPGAPVLPGGYDFARAAWFKSLGGVGFAPGNLKYLDTQAPSGIWQFWQTRIARLRQQISERAASQLPGQTGAIAAALLTGERGGISQETNDAFRASGLFHILSISGLHMAIMGGAVFIAIRFALAAFPSVALNWPIKKIAALGAILGAAGYLMISGGSIATVRSFLMITVMFIAILLDRPALALRNVAIAALIVLVLTPEAIHNVGFQMSFAAVVALVASYEAIAAYRREHPRVEYGTLTCILAPIIAIVGSTLIASAAVAPFTIYHFQQSQQYAILGNLLAVPICNIVVMPAALAALVLMLVGLDWPAFVVMGFGIDGMRYVADAIAALPGATLRISVISHAGFAPIVAGGLVLALVGSAWRLLGLTLITAGIVVAPMRAAPDILVGRAGGLVAVRGADGTYSVVTAPKRADYELKRWLEYDGDDRDPTELLNAQRVRCNSGVCRAQVSGLTLAVPQNARAARSACKTFNILIMPGNAPRNCKQPDVIIDRRSLKKEGAHALYISGNSKLTVDTVAAQRGKRPWSTSNP